MSAFRFSGCRHPLSADQLVTAQDGQVRMCGACEQTRVVREVESVRDLARLPDGGPRVWGKDTRDTEDVRRPLMQAIGKGQLALLVTDAAGVVIAGIRATGGLTQLQYRPQDGTWEFAGAFSGPEILEGSYVLRDLGLRPEPPGAREPTGPAAEQLERYYRELEE